MASVDIEQIVREVLARLRPPGPHSKLDGPRAADDVANRSVVNERVITRETLRDCLAGAAELLVPTGAIVTPAAADVLRDRGVRLTYRAAESTGGPRVALGAAAERFDAAQTAAALRRRGWEVQQVVNSGLVGVTAEVVDAVTRGGAAGVIVTDRSAAGACLANRRRGVRAIEASGDDIAVRCRETGANLLVLSPTGASGVQIARQIERFLGGWPWPCPAELSDD